MACGVMPLVRNLPDLHAVSGKVSAGCPVISLDVRGHHYACTVSAMCCVAWASCTIDSMPKAPNASTELTISMDTSKQTAR